MRRNIALILIFTLAFSAGCGPRFEETATVTGTLTLNGKPAPGFSVVFHPERGRPASGTTDKEGHFSLSTFGSGDGAVLGEHTVIIADDFPDGVPPMGPAAARQSRVPMKYRTMATTPFKETVTKGGENHFVFDMDMKP